MAVNEDTRIARVQALVAALPPEHETIRVPWKGGQIHASVIRIELRSLVLNASSHRIKAQLESDIEASKLIALDPFSDESHAAISRILRSTLGFEALKASLSDEGQRDPGIITHSGLLVNANTRAVALEDLGIEYIDVAVLPTDTTIGQLYDIELELQVARDFRQEYTFTNELLFVDDLIISQNRDEMEVAKRLQWTIPGRPKSTTSGIEKMRRYVRHLNLIREVQQMSGGRIPLTDFDNTEQALQEFDSEFERLRDSRPVQALQLKQARILALLVDLGYDKMRQIDASWVEAFLPEALDENDLFGPLVGPILKASEAANSDGSLDELGDLGDFLEETPEDVSACHVIVDFLVTVLSQSAGQDHIVLPTAEGNKEFDRNEVTVALNDLMRSAAEDAKTAAKAGSELKLPESLANDAAKKLQRSREALERVRGKDGFDAVGVIAAAEHASRSLDALNTIIKSNNAGNS